MEIHTHTHTHTHTHPDTNFTFILQSTKPITKALVLVKTQVILIVLSENVRIKILPPLEEN
jgi:hypothetical protein